MRKKFGIIALVLCFVCCCAVMFSACKKQDKKETPAETETQVDVDDDADKDTNKDPENGSEQPAEHSHDYETTWTTNSTHHWYKCKGCDDEKDKAEHEFEWIIDEAADYGKAGSKHEECSICHYEKAAVGIDPLVKSTPNVNLVKTFQTYNANSVGLTLGTDYTISEGASAPTIKWYNKGESTALVSAPQAAGEYEIEFCFAESATFDSANIKKDFEIKAKALEGTLLACHNLAAPSTADGFLYQFAVSEESGLVAGDAISINIYIASNNAGVYAKSDIAKIECNSNYSVDGLTFVICDEFEGNISFETCVSGAKEYYFVNAENDEFECTFDLEDGSCTLRLLTSTGVVVPLTNSSDTSFSFTLDQGTYFIEIVHSGNGECGSLTMA